MPSTGTDLRVVFLTAALVCGLPASALAVDAPLPEFPAPTADTAAALQARFQAQATLASVDGAVDVVQRLRDANDKAGDGKTDIAACRARAVALDAAARHDPFGLAVWYYKRRCAQALGNAAEAAHSEQAFATVLRQMLAGLPPDDGRTAIGLYATADGTALIDASGEHLIYSYFDVSDLQAGLRWRVGLRDPASGRERELSFDLLRNRLKLVHKPSAAEVPLLLVGSFEDLADSFFKDYTQKDGLPATLDALDGMTSERRSALIAQLTKRSDLSSALVLNRYCVAHPDAACTGKAVDHLLDFAEKGSAQAMLALAYAYLRGQDVKHDDAAARTLLLGAAKTLGTGAAFQRYLDLDQDFASDATDLPQWALVQLLTAADKGDALAAGVALQLLGRTDKLQADPARVLALRAQVRTAGLAYMEQRYLLSASAREKAWPEVVQAAQTLYAMHAPDSDRAAAAVRLWTIYLGGNHPGVAPDPVQALQWARTAGMDGNVPAMRYVGLIHADQTHDPESLRLAVAWLLPAARAGDTSAMFALARLAEGDYPALVQAGEGNAQLAAKIYRTFAEATPETPEAAQARRALAALMLDGHGTRRDPAGARALLEHDANAGNAGSALALAQDLYGGRFGVRDADGAKRWLDKALAKPEPAVAAQAADLLFLGVALPADQERAIALWQQAAAQGYTVAWNEMAWALCTAPDAAARNPARGLQSIARIAPADRTAGELDTVAACQAATGDFAAAIVSQQQAIAGVEPHTDTAARMRERLGLYQTHRAYLQPPPKASDAAPQAPSAMPTKRS